MYFLAQAATADPLSPWLTPIYNLGGFGLLLFLLLVGKLWTKAAYEKQEQAADAWKTAYEIERDAHIKLQQDRQAQLERDQITHKLLEDLKSSARTATGQ